MPATRRIRLAAVQAAPAFLDLAASLERLEHWAERAAGAGAAVIAFPESWLPGYPVWLDVTPGAALWDDALSRRLFVQLWEQAVEVPGPVTERVARLAARLGVTLVVGLHERSGRTLYNTALTCGPDGGLLNRHRKLMPTHGERLVWGLGDGAGLRVVSASDIRLGGLICWEHWMPLARQALHDAGEDVHVALWPSVKEMHQVASRHYAFEGRCFVVASGSILRADQLPRDVPLSTADPAPPGGLLLNGGSAIIAPDGRYLAGPVYDQETVVAADCDLNEIPGQAFTLDVSGHYSRPDLFTLTVTRTPREDPA